MLIFLNFKIFFRYTFVICFFSELFYEVVYFTNKLPSGLFLYQVYGSILELICIPEIFCWNTQFWVADNGSVLNLLMTFTEFCLSYFLFHYQYYSFPNNLDLFLHL